MISPVTMSLRQNICRDLPANQQSRWRRMNGCGDFNSKTSRKLSRCHSLLFAWPVKETKIENFDNSKSAASWWCWVGTCTSQCPTINSELHSLTFNLRKKHFGKFRRCPWPILSWEVIMDMTVWPPYRPLCTVKCLWTVNIFRVLSKYFTPNC